MKTFLLNNNLKFNSGKKLKKNFLNLDVTSIIGIVLSPIALFTNSFATFSLPKSMQKAQALVPALQSNWLMMHVTVMMLSYAALLCGSLLSIAFLVVMWIYRKSNTNKILNVNNLASNTNNKIILNKNLNNDKKILDDNYKNTTIIYSKSELKYSSNLLQTQTSASLQSELVQIFPTQRQKKNNQLDNQLSPIISLAKTLDNFSYRILGIGFPLLTVGILSGAVWANEAWGSYWSWDPKETWAFITWLIFAIYLHTRINKGWQGEKPALLAGFGFFIVWICYLGVNILGTGLHSYGWVKFNA